MDAYMVLFMGTISLLVAFFLLLWTNIFLTRDYRKICNENEKMKDELKEKDAQLLEMNRMKLCGICKHHQERNCVKPYGTKTCEMWELAE